MELLRKFLSFSFGSGIGLAINFLGTIVTTRLISPEDFGKASMFILTLNILTIIVIFGTDQSFVRFFYEEDSAKRGKLLYNCLRLPIVLAGATVFIILIFDEQVSVFLFGEENRGVALILALGVVSQVLYRYGTLVIRMQQKGILFSIVEILNRSFNLIFLLLLYYFMGASYEVLIYSTVVTVMILSIVTIFVEKKYWSFSNFAKAELRNSSTDTIKYAYPLVLTSLITWLFQSFDKIAIKHWGNFEELGLYAAAFKIIGLLSVLQVTFSTFWAPVCFEHYEKNPQDKRLFEWMSKLVSFTMFIIAVACIMGKDIIVLLLGKEYKDAAEIMPFLVFMPIMYTISETTVIGINFYKKVNWHILIAGASCLVSILGNFILVPRYGAIGAAVATAISFIVFFSLRTHLSLKYYKVDYGLKRIYTILAIIIMYALCSAFYKNTLLDVVVGAGIVTLMAVLYFGDFMGILKQIKRRQSTSS
ncbi:oligosaccharide flippase family protein [Paenibacillaceae bacterium WGS1546]|uniref:oligosaccharide flippase family protein n=1 Tax=Cohnella sp. WGS1546 TaxID=3366810 RepID=UPI00372D50B8